MIKSITVINYLNEKLTLELKRPEKSGFAVTRIDGLGPVKANINTVEVSTRDGSSFNSARTTQRNIVMSLRYVFQNSIEDVRQQSYKYFPVKKPLTLIIETDNRILGIEGYVESNEPDIFSKDESAQISIICPNPHFYSAGTNGQKTVTFYGIEPAFEFPFSNESLSSDNLLFGTIERHGERNVVYSGDVNTGMTILLSSTGDAENVKIYNLGTRETMEIDTSKLETLTGHKIIAGDEITICTSKGSKSVTLLRNGKYTNILNCLTKNSDWFELVKGDNIFAFTADEGQSDLSLTIKYNVLYEGV